MSQEVKEIDIKDLVLWTENPRDPIDEDANDQDIVIRATEDRKGKWELRKLAKKMGDIYDFSDLPIVVYKNGKPIVYDGNRRMILAKLKHGIAQSDAIDLENIPSIPRLLPCNVCSEDVALNHINRKHGESGSWSPLQQDIFQHKFLQREKSLFLALDEQTQIISNNPHMDQGFVKKELFNNERLKELGFKYENGTIKSKHTPAESKKILQDISNKVEVKAITTRESRGRVVDVLETENRKTIEKNRSQNFRKVTFQTQPRKSTKPRTRKQSKLKIDFFSEKLILELGEVNNLYRDIYDLNEYYYKNRSKLSTSFPALIRMALRLLCETAAKERSFQKIHSYINKYYTDAKKGLDSDQKTWMSTQNVNDKSLIQLLQSGAHTFTASANYEQTVGMSLIIGQIIKLSHGKQ